jgi:hypothetical protein
MCDMIYYQCMSNRSLKDVLSPPLYIVPDVQPKSLPYLAKMLSLRKVHIWYGDLKYWSVHATKHT